MNKYLKCLSAGVFALGSAGFIACGDDSSSSFDMEDSFEIVLKKAEYSYKSKDSTLKVIYPVCEVSTAGTLVGPDDASEWDTLVYDAYLNKSTVKVREDGEKSWKSYTFKDSKSFPTGLWLSPETSKNSLQYATRFTKKDEIQEVFRYDGNCFAADVVSQLFEENEAMAEADDAFLTLFKKFLPKNDETSEDSLKKKLVRDVKKVDCDEIMINGIFVKIKMTDFNENSGKLQLRYSKDDDVACDVDFRIRYAMNQTDCEEAYDEYKASGSKDDFDFDDYSKSVAFDGKDQAYCVTKLVNSIMEDNNMTLKQAASEVSGNDMLKAIVDVVLKGFKK